MSKRSIDIFNANGLEVRNNFLTHNADVLIIKKQRINKPSGFLFILYYFLFSCLFSPAFRYQFVPEKL